MPNIRSILNIKTVFVAFAIILGLIYFSLKFLIPEIAKNELQNQIKNKFGITITIDQIVFEPIELSLEVQGLTVENTHKIKKLYIDVSFMRLLFGELVVSNTIVDGLIISVKKEKDKFLIENIPPQLKKKETSPSQTTKKTNPWRIVLKSFVIKNSKLLLNDGPQLSLDYFGVKNFYSYPTKKETKLDIKLRIDKSKISLKGKLKDLLVKLKDLLVKPNGNVLLTTDKLDLDFLNFLEFRTFGKIEGSLKTNTELEFTHETQKIKTDIEFKELKFFSKNNKTIEYYLKDLKLSEGNIINESERIEVKANSLELENFILSIPSHKLTKKKINSKYTNIHFKDIKLVSPQKLSPSSEAIQASTKIQEGGWIKFKQQYQESKKVLTTEVRNLGLLPFSATFENFMGYQITSGKLDLKYEATTKNKDVKGKVYVTLKQFKIDDQDESGNKTKEDDSIPLPAALGMVKNDNGVIDLEIDVSGSENDPQFGFIPMLKVGLGSIVLSKFGSIIATRAATQLVPLMLSSIPFSPANAFLLVNGGYKILTKPRFEDIKFNIGTDEIVDDSVLVIKKLKKFLKENKKMNFELCPLVILTEGGTENSISLTENQSLDLAQKRIGKVKSLFSDSSEIIGQLHFCRPKITKKTSSVGIMEINL